MLVMAERAFTDLVAGEYRTVGDSWDVDEERANELESFQLCSIVPEPPKPRRRTTRKKTTKSE